MHSQPMLFVGRDLGRPRGLRGLVVCDGYTDRRHLVWGDLDGRARYIMGEVGRRLMPAIEECAGLILLGYHAMGGTPEAMLDHTMDSMAVQNVYLNGRKTGSIGILAAIAGENGVPTIMLSGDDKACAEAKEFVPGVLPACVKRGLASEGGLLMGPGAAHALITETAAAAVRTCSQIKPVRIPSPVTMRMEMASRGRFPGRGEKPYLTIIDGRTYEVTGESVEQAFWRLG